MYTRKAHLCARRTRSQCLCLYSSDAITFVDFARFDHSEVVRPKSNKCVRECVRIKIYYISVTHTTHKTGYITISQRNWMNSILNAYFRRCVRFPVFCALSHYSIESNRAKSVQTVHFRDDRFWFSHSSNREMKSNMQWLCALIQLNVENGIQAINYLHFIEFCYDFSHNSHTNTHHHH